MVCAGSCKCICMGISRPQRTDLIRKDAAVELSLRLEALLAVIDPHSVLADIGTDHAFLPIELIRRGVCRKVIACDVGAGPLQRAADHVKEAGLCDQIETRLADGLLGLCPGEADAVVIAGMGGALMASILEKAEGMGILEHLDQLVLQPQSEFEKVREAMQHLGFTAVKERMVEDRGKFYWIISAVRNADTVLAVSSSQAKPWAARYGTLLPGSKDPVFLSYMERQIRKTEMLLRELEGKEGEAASSRRNELMKTLQDLNEIFTM